jgi:hypothetical protein
MNSYTGASLLHWHAVRLRLHFFYSTKLDQVYISQHKRAIRVRLNLTPAAVTSIRVTFYYASVQFE